jgi:hypothetical protein
LDEEQFVKPAGVPATTVTPEALIVSVTVTTPVLAAAVLFVTVIVEVTGPPAGVTVSTLLVLETLRPPVAVSAPGDGALTGDVRVAPALDCDSVPVAVNVTLPEAPPVSPVMTQFASLPATLVLCEAPVNPVNVHVPAVTPVMPVGKAMVTVPLLTPVSCATIAVYVTVLPIDAEPVVPVNDGDVMYSASADRQWEPRAAKTARAARRTSISPNFLVPTV